MAARGRSQADDLLAAELAAGATVAQAAAAAKVSERTTYRRLADPGFARKVSQVRNRMLGQAVGRLASNGSLAALVLATMATSAKNEASRVAAAKGLLEFMFKGIEVVDHEERLAALEAAARDAKKKAGAG
jgi:hypothetical protein